MLDEGCRVKGGLQPLQTGSREFLGWVPLAPPGLPDVRPGFRHTKRRAKNALPKAVFLYDPQSRTIHGACVLVSCSKHERQDHMISLLAVQFNLR